MTEILRINGLIKNVIDKLEKWLFTKFHSIGKFVIYKLHDKSMLRMTCILISTSLYKIMPHLNV